MLWVILYYLLEALKWLIIIRALLSWFVAPHSSNPLVRIVRRATDPILRPLSEMLPPMGGMDVSPLLAFFAIYLFQQLILRMIY
jgi:YggT family protein